MEKYIITGEMTAGFIQHLYSEEHVPSTIKKYSHTVESFQAWMAGKPVTKETVSQWKESLLRSKTAGTVNGALAALHSFFAFVGWEHCRVKYLKIQRKVFRDNARELTKEEYKRLVKTANAQGKGRLSLLLETICATGVRVSEVRYITVEAARRRRTDIAMKGKIRTILIPGKLARKILKYAREEKIACGEIFLTASKKRISRRQIWGEMKRLCQAAAVDETKVFPHNLRHLFARTFYQTCRDIVKLADILGHSDIETTRIYLMSTGWEHQKHMEKLGLLL